MKINGNNWLSDYIEQYNIWKYNKEFYDKTTYIDIDDSIDGIPVFNFADVENINNESSKIIIIYCLSEGLNQYDWFNQYNDEKFYIIFSGSMWANKQTLINKNIRHLLIWYPFF